MKVKWCCNKRSAAKQVKSEWEAQKRNSLNNPKIGVKWNTLEASQMRKINTGRNIWNIKQNMKSQRKSMYMCVGVCWVSPWYAALHWIASGIYTTAALLETGAYFICIDAIQWFLPGPISNFIYLQFKNNNKINCLRHAVKILDRFIIQYNTVCTRVHRNLIPKYYGAYT